MQVFNRGAHQPPEGKSILIVDDDQQIGEALQLALAAETPYRILWMAESDLALLSVSSLHPSLILLDYRMPVLDGLRLYDQFQLCQSMRGVPVVLISAVYALPYQQLQQRGIRVLRKPLHIPTLVKVIEEQIALGREAPRG
jgi:PleD family two-component response regulator